MRQGVSGSGNALWGVALILIGGVLLLDRFHMIDVGGVWRFWPLVVMYFGAVQLLAPRDGRRSAWLLLLGIWLLLSSVEAFGLHYGNSWSLLIMFVGLAMVLDPLFKRERRAQAPHGEDASSDS